MTARQIRSRFARNFYLSEAVGFGLGVPLAALYALALESHLMGQALGFIIMITAVIVVFVAYPMNFFLTRRNGKFLQDFYEGKLKPQEIERGFLRLIRLPIRQSLYIFLRIGIGVVIFITYALVVLKGAPVDIFTTFIFSFFGVYIAALVNYLVVFRIIDKPLKDIIASEALPVDRIRAQRHFGIAFNTRSVLFFFVPVLVGYLNVFILSILNFGGSTPPEVFKSRLINMVAINLLSFLLGFIVLSTTERRLMAGLIRSMDMLAASGGDLTYRIPTNLEDEFGYIAYQMNTVFAKFLQLIRKLKDIIRQTRGLADRLVEASSQAEGSLQSIGSAQGTFQDQVFKLKQEVEQSSNAVTIITGLIGQVNRRIEDQSASVTESSASVEQAMASITNLSRMAEQKKGLIENLTTLAREGETNMKEMLQSIETIARSAGGILETMDVINRVAKETSLLAMNAAIEAAHAGEYGKGFSVVADEMRKLSETTADNARSISNTLTAIIQSIQKSAQVSRDTGKSIGRILEGINDLAQSMGEMILGMQEIASGSSQVIEALSNLVQITEDVRSSSQEIDGRAKTIEESINLLNRLSEGTTNEIAELKTGLEQIKELFDLLADLGGRNKENLTGIEHEFSQFHTGDDAGQADQLKGPSLDAPKLLIEKEEKQG